MCDSANHVKVNLKRKVFSKGRSRGGNYKRYKRMPKFIRDNPENQVAREKERDPYHFSDSEDDQDDDLGMGLEISDLPFLDDNHGDKQKSLIALTQDSVRPFFSSPLDYDESKLDEALADLRHSSFRPNQKETIKRILFGRSTLFISPTGSGKSLCYQLPALLYWRYRKYMTIVVSPLISLMEDQMNNFPSCLKAVRLYSGMNKLQKRHTIEQLVKQEAQVVFISPEAIVGGILDLDDLKNLPPVGFVCIDEAHCLSEWSHNFRPAYLQFLKILNDQLNIKTYLALTATSTRATSFAIAKSLTINPDNDVIGRTTVPDNLILSVSYEVNKDMALMELLKTPTFRIMPSIIVYCNRREDTDSVASRIRTSMQDYSTLVEVPERRRKSVGSKDDSIRSIDSNSSGMSDEKHMKLSWHAESYHAGLSTETRKRIQRQFIKGEIRVVVATIAFGMGINKANVRAIIHYDMPGSFESYVQEIGRAGRDGKPAQCHMFLKADQSDLYYQQRNIYSSITEPKNLTKLTEYLFKPCGCADMANKEELEKLDKLNKLAPHEISSWRRTKFTNEPVVQNLNSEDNDDDDDDSQLLNSDDENIPNAKENIVPTKYVHKSIVKKHRCCLSHEVAFSVEEASEKMNLRTESIITLICQLQQAYPQLKIEQYTPIKSTCNIFCYKGPAQMEALRNKCQPVDKALGLHMVQQIRETGSKGEQPNRLSFDVVQVARLLGMPYADAVRQLKKTEWELVEKTGNFRRSQVKVTFEGNSFHLRSVGDLSEEELREINNFLIDFTSLYESVERERVAKVYHTMRRHCIDVDKMKIKDLRLEASSRLKAALNSYFDSPLEPQVPPQPLSNSHHAQLNDSNNTEINISSILIGDCPQEKLSDYKRDIIRKSARSFISAHGNEHTPRTIARIFQGISTPNYPAELWGTNRKWWRIHLDVDFLQLVSIIASERI